jgi:hypothetical protein
MFGHQDDQHHHHDDDHQPMDDVLTTPLADNLSNDNDNAVVGAEFNPALPSEPFGAAPAEPEAPAEEVVAPVADETPALEEPTAPVAAIAPVSEDLLNIKQQALTELSPLVGHLEQSPEEKFRTTMMMIQANDNQDLIKVAYEAAQAIEDEKVKAQALLDIVNEINYFTQHAA